MKRLKAFLLLIILGFSALVFVGATMHPLGDYQVWAITGPWNYSNALKEYVTYAQIQNPAYSSTPDTLLPSASCTSGWFKVKGNRIYINGLWDGDTSAGKDSAAGNIHFDCALDTTFTYVMKHDSMTFADSTTDANGLVITDSLDGIPGLWGRFRYDNISADTTGNIEIAGVAPYGYFID